MITQVLASPPWTSLRELEFASLQLEKDVLTDRGIIEMAQYANGPWCIAWRGTTESKCN